MRSFLKIEGWLCSSLLPTNWFYKITKDGTSFLDSDGELYRNKDKALISLKQNNRTTEFGLLSSFKSAGRDYSKKSSSDDEWKEFNVEPLAGWKYKEVAAGQTRYQSPSGDFFKGKSHLMKFLIQNKLSKDTISAMRSSFKSDGWKTHEDLPESWMWKKSGNNRMFLSPRGAVLNSKEDAVNHISSYGYPQSDLDMISSFKK